MEALGLIPARGGSRGIPDKNLALLGGRSLLAWTCEQALASDRLARCAVSTDSPEIADAAREAGVEVIDRPAALAADETPMLDVVQHALDQTPGADPVVLLQPTSPLRRSSDIDAALERWERTGADSVVSVVRVPHSFTPGSQLRRDQDGRLEPYTAGERATLRQEKPVLYARNGPAVLVVRADVVRGGSLYGNDCRAYEMAPEDSIDVDEPLDLELAAFLLERRGRLNG
jgi:CMP-N,N'-diacetyllegionaminic acid synthase